MTASAFSSREDLRQHIRRVWPERDKREHSRDRLREAGKLPTVGSFDIDHHTAVAVKAVAGILLRRDVAPWLARDLTWAWNITYAPDVLSFAEVDGLLDEVAARELQRRETPALPMMENTDDKTHH